MKAYTFLGFTTERAEYDILHLLRTGQLNVIGPQLELRAFRRYPTVHVEALRTQASPGHQVADALRTATRVGRLPCWDTEGDRARAQELSLYRLGPTWWVITRKDLGEPAQIPERVVQDAVQACRLRVRQEQLRPGFFYLEASQGRRFSYLEPSSSVMGVLIKEREFFERRLIRSQALWGDLPRWREVIFPFQVVLSLHSRRTTGGAQSDFDSWRFAATVEVTEFNALEQLLWLTENS